MSGEIRQLRKRIRRALIIYKRGREELVDFLYEAADKLDGHHKNVKITKVVTGSTAIVGTVTGLIGLAFAIPTGGISLVVTVGGSVLAAISGATQLGSDIVKHILDQSYINKLAELSRMDEENWSTLNNYLERYDEEFRNNVPNNNISCETGIDIFKELSSLTNLGCSIIRVTRVASTAARSIQVLGTVSAVLGVATLPFQIIDLARDGRALNTNERSKKADQFRELAMNLLVAAYNKELNIIETLCQHEQQLQQQPNYQDNRQINTFNPITVIFFPLFLIIMFLIT